MSRHQGYQPLLVCIHMFSPVHWPSTCFCCRVLQLILFIEKQSLQPVMGYLLVEWGQCPSNNFLKDFHHLKKPFQLSSWDLPLLNNSLITAEPKMWYYCCLSADNLWKLLVQVHISSIVLDAEVEVLAGALEANSIGGSWALVYVRNPLCWPTNSRYILGFPLSQSLKSVLPFTNDNIQDATIFVASSLKMTLILTWLET
jgi:hypothetical protein